MSDLIRVAVLGSGNIGTDLCERILLDEQLELVAFVGRRLDSPGLARMSGRAKYILSNGIESLDPYWDEIHGVFDATSAFDHKKHWDTLKIKKKWAVDLTPSKIGLPFVPELANLLKDMTISSNNCFNYSMVTCGGQSSAPIVFAMAKHSFGIQEVEVSSSIAALSAGPATRKNIDQYISSTESLISIISNCKNVKALLVLNPAEPPVMMRTTVHMRVDKCDLNEVKYEADKIIKKISQYVPGYELIIEPYFSARDTISATVKVTGAGYALPEYAGNLDIINAAAVETAKRHFRGKM